MMGVEVVVCGIQRLRDKQWSIVGSVASVAVVARSGMVLWFWDI